MNKVFIVFGLIIVLTIIPGGIIFYQMNKEGLANLKACEEMQSGMPHEELFERLGQPIYSKRGPESAVYYFESPSFLNANVSAVIEKDKTIVGKIRCRNDEGWR